MAYNTLTREPWRGGQICGWQIAYGLPGSRFCGRRKAPGGYTCVEHWEPGSDDGILWAPGNALGDPGEPLVLSWEPHEGTDPIPATPEEIAAWKGAERIKLVRADQLSRGDRLVRDWDGSDPHIVIGDPEPAEDFFGREGHFQILCRMTDGSREGYRAFGPEGRALRCLRAPEAD